MFQNTRKPCCTSSHRTVSFISNQSSLFHHHSSYIITIQRTMPPATNVLLHGDSLQSDSLGDACVIAVLASVMMLLHLIEVYLMKNKNKSKKRDSTYRRIIQRRCTIQSLYREYGSLFARAYRMNYEGFMVPHDKLKQGIQEYITNNNNRTEYS